MSSTTIAFSIRASSSMLVTLAGAYSSSRVTKMGVWLSFTHEKTFTSPAKDPWLSPGLGDQEVTSTKAKGWDWIKREARLPASSLLRMERSTSA